MQQKKYTNLKDFYPFYLTEHKNTVNRILHFIGTGMVVLCLITAILFHNLWFFAVAPIFGYGFGFVGHFFFEKNKPATFKYPFFSLAGDFLLFGDLMTGKQSFDSIS